MRELLRTKTFWAALALGVSATSGYFTGDMSGQEAIGQGIMALAGMFMRQGILKSGPAS